MADHRNPLRQYQEGNEWKAVFSYIRSKAGWRGFGLLAKIAVSSVNPYTGRGGQGPLYAGWDLSYQCNARCIHCTRWHDSNSGKEVLSLKEICRVCRELKDTGVRFICLAGGEPLLIEELPEIIRYMKDLGLITSICTNGALLAERADDLVQSGLDHIVVSMDGSSRSHDFLRGVTGFYKLAERGIETIIGKRLKGKPSVSVRMLLHEDNIDEIPLLVSRWGKTGDGIFLQPLHGGTDNFYTMHGLRKISSIPRLRKILESTGLETNFYNSLMVRYLETPEHFKRMPCLAGHFVVRIGPDGNVYPCVEQHDLVGNLKDQTFREIWNGTKFHMVRKKLARQKTCSCFYNDMFMNVYLWKAHEKIPILRQILHSRFDAENGRSG
ncbi:MAG: radical SAM protein [Syntrophorhabdaceae bacterium]